jgi:hypothetical protein
MNLETAIVSKISPYLSTKFRNINIINVDTKKEKVHIMALVRYRVVYE